MPGRRLWSALLVLAVWPLPAQASTLLLAGGEALPLQAWIGFCEHHPDECRVDPAEAETVASTPETMHLVEVVNRSVNRAVRPQTDQDHWGVADRWDFPSDGVGDCEDYQLLKRKRLIEAGLPRRAMLMTVVLDENGEGHAVLTLRTDREELILDNKRDALLRWHETGYRFIKRESSEARTGWVFLRPGPGLAGPEVVAAR